MRKGVPNWQQYVVMDEELTNPIHFRNLFAVLNSHTRFNLHDDNNIIICMRQVLPTVLIETGRSEHRTSSTQSPWPFWGWVFAASHDRFSLFLYQLLVHQGVMARLYSTNFCLTHGYHDTVRTAI